MHYLLDTNAASGVIRGKKPLLTQRLTNALRASHHVSIPVIVAYELWFGAYKSAFRTEQSERVKLFLAMFGTPEAFVAEDAEIAAATRSVLAAKGSMIGPYDLLIAAQAIRLKAILVTNNVSEFSRIPDLSWEDWSSEDAARDK